MESLSEYKSEENALIFASHDKTLASFCDKRITLSDTIGVDDLAKNETSST